MTEPICIEERDVLHFHNRLLEAHGGAAGLRDRGLLLSALARPQQHFAYAEHPDIVELASFYTDGIVRNHPFIDGNKRTGFVAGILFLELNGCRFTASEEDSAHAVLDLAASVIDTATYASFIRSHTTPT